VSEGTPDRPVLALTLGEPAGIGPDLAIDAWMARKTQDIPAFAFVGPAWLLKQRAKLMSRTISTADVRAEDARDIFDTAIPCLDTVSERPVEASVPNPGNADLVTGSIETAVDLVHSGRCSAVVTNPIHKKVLSDAGFSHPGHTEFLGELSQRVFGVTARPVMMLAAPDLKTIPVTIHVALRDVFALLTTDLIVETGRIVAHDLQTRFGIDQPRLAVSGLNPHAGEDGLMGNEDADIIRPAVDRLVADGITASGPYPADSMFHASARNQYDAALCMYHDQALIPVKTLAFDKAVNVTLGLPFVRTSPDHGTAFDIAGSGKANPSSLIAALKMAELMSAAMTGGSQSK
jgi:4-hydroxythreonine-4-phosphate dehydrogenase